MIIEVLKKYKWWLLLLVVFTLSYLVFYYPVIFQNKFIVGNDAVYYFYPMRYFLHQNLVAGEIPFWTEKMLGGFPIYADGESGYLNPINLLATLLFGPFTSYKVLHYSFFLAGALGLASFLRRKKFNTFGILVSVFTYYFSFFLLFHQQHFGITLSFFLFPLTFNLFDISINKPTFKNLGLFVLTLLTILYFGSYQSVVIIFAILGLYFLTNFDFSGNDIKKKLSRLILAGAVLLSLSIPLLYPTFKLYQSSARVTDEPEYTEGSFNPLMVSNLAYPFLFDRDETYRWNTISDDYLEHETYVYFGISAFILGVFGFVFNKNKRLKSFIAVLILFYLILGHIRFYPIIKNHLIFPFSMFRYWGRSVIVFVFAFSISAGYLLSFLDKIEFDYKKLFNKWVLLFAFLWLTSVLFSFIDSGTSEVIIQQIKNGAIPRDTNFYVWFGIALVALVSVFLLHSKQVKYFLIFLVFFDLAFFGHQVLGDYIRDFSKIYDHSYVSNFERIENDRIFSTHERSLGNQGLYLDGWSLLGYSQFYNPDYAALLRDFGVSKAKRFVGNFNPNLDYVSLGVSYIYNEGTLTSIPTNVTRIKNASDAAYSIVEESEDHMNFRYTSQETVKFKTTIKFPKSWEVRIDGVPVDSKGDLYLFFNAPSGEHVVELNYVPRDFYKSLTLSLLSISFLSILTLGFRFYKPIVKSIRVNLNRIL